MYNIRVYFGSTDAPWVVAEVSPSFGCALHSALVVLVSKAGRTLFVRVHALRPCAFKTVCFQVRNSPLEYGRIDKGASLRFQLQFGVGLLLYGLHLCWTYVRSGKQADADLIAEMQSRHGWKLEMLQISSPCIVVFLPGHIWNVLVCMVDFPHLNLLFHGSGMRACKHDGAISLACQLPSVRNAAGTHPLEPVEQFSLAWLYYPPDGTRRSGHIARARSNLTCYPAAVWLPLHSFCAHVMKSSQVCQEGGKRTKSLFRNWTGFPSSQYLHICQIGN